MNLKESFDRLDAALDAKLVCRGAWTCERDGRQMACTLATLAPITGERESADACPVELMPAWMAHLVVWLDDNPTDEHWPTVIRRYAKLARRFPVLDAKGWERAGYTVGIAIMRVARTTGENDKWGCRDVLDAMIAAFERRERGEDVPQKEFDDLAARAAWAAEAAKAAAGAAGAEEAAKAAWEAWAVWAAGAAWAAEAEEADRVADAILDALDVAITRAERSNAAPTTGSRDAVV